MRLDACCSPCRRAVAGRSPGGLLRRCRLGAPASAHHCPHASCAHPACSFTTSSPTTGPITLQLQQRQCELRYQSLARPDAGWPPILLARGPGVPLVAGAPMAIWGPQLPEYDLLPGRLMFGYGAFNCSDSIQCAPLLSLALLVLLLVLAAAACCAVLPRAAWPVGMQRDSTRSCPPCSCRPALQECVVVGTPQDLAAACSADSACDAFVIKPLAGAPGAAHRPLIPVAWVRPGRCCAWRGGACGPSCAPPGAPPLLRRAPQRGPRRHSEERLQRQHPGPVAH